MGESVGSWDEGLELGREVWEVELGILSRWVEMKLGNGGSAEKSPGLKNGLGGGVAGNTRWAGSKGNTLVAPILR